LPAGHPFNDFFPDFSAKLDSRECVLKNYRAPSATIHKYDVRRALKRLLQAIYQVRSITLVALAPFFAD